MNLLTVEDVALTNVHFDRIIPTSSRLMIELDGTSFLIAATITKNVIFVKPLQIISHFPSR